MNATAKPVNRLHWMPWFCSDYVGATRGLTLAQRGALTDLLMLSWISGPLPPDTDRLAAMVGATTSEFRQIWPAISSWWIETPDHLLVNAELEQRRSKARQAYEGRAAAARASVAKRKASVIAATRKSLDSGIRKQKGAAAVEDEEL